MSRIRTLLAAAAAAALLSLAFASPAYAHDELVGSSPASGDRLAGAPAEITLDFSADVMTVGAAVIIADGQGRDWVLGEPAVDMGRVTVVVDPEMPVAGYEIRWRVVSSDGHPISGLIPFTIGDAEPLTRTAAATPIPGALAAGDDTADQGTQETSGAVRIALIGAGGAAVAAVFFIAIHFIRRRFARRDTGGTNDPAHTAGSTRS
ncbi:copper resistance CopC family protein [Microbacterium oleivorans]|uniref:Copper resistance protein CopC n=1 Tax=Microbacterium oleivorans TaxID=273677 RepID=A0A7D5EVF6_9MICO|nr:copper resistance CopC family protein [Microbacterium oleivorans]QLD11792.1 copper resistance protein CopC [Microbacterium oleivorans]